MTKLTPTQKTALSLYLFAVLWLVLAIAFAVLGGSDVAKWSSIAICTVYLVGAWLTTVGIKGDRGPIGPEGRAGQDGTESVHYLLSDPGPDAPSFGAAQTLELSGTPGDEINDVIRQLKALASKNNPVKTLGDIADVFEEWKSRGIAAGSVEYMVDRVWRGRP